MEKFIHSLDPYDYPSKYPLYDPTTKKVPFIKIVELNDKVLHVVVSLLSKVYNNEYTGGKKISSSSVLKTVKTKLNQDLFKEGVPFHKVVSDKNDDTATFILSSDSGQ